MLCPKCNNANKEDAKYCSSCGADLTASREKKCPYCQAQNESQASFCSSCGASLTKMPEAPAQINAGRLIWKSLCLGIGVLGFLVGLYLAYDATGSYNLYHGIGHRSWFEYGGDIAIFFLSVSLVLFVVGCAISGKSQK